MMYEPEGEDDQWDGDRGRVGHGEGGDLPRKMDRPTAAIVEKEMIDRPWRA